MSIRTEFEKVIPILAKWWVRDTTFSVLVAFSGMLMAKSAIEYGYDFAMRRFGYLPPEAPPVGSDFGATEYLAVFVLIVAIGYRLWVVKGTRAETADQLTREALMSSSTGSVLQLEHRKAFDILATVPEIEALRAHPTNALEMMVAHASGARHVVWDGIWFRLASKHHGVKTGPRPDCVHGFGGRRACDPGRGSRNVCACGLCFRVGVGAGCGGCPAGLRFGLLSQGS